MIVNKNTMDARQFKVIFAKKFKNFCSKLPILISYKLMPNGIIVYEHFDEENEENKQKILTYDYDYLLSVQKNIYNIKKMLYPYFPEMKQKIVKEVHATAEEVNTKISSGEISLDDVTSNGYLLISEKKWQIEKVIVGRDEIFIRDMDSKSLYRYKLKYPVVTFLKKMRNNEITYKDAWEFFVNKAKQLPLDPNDDGERENEE